MRSPEGGFYSAEDADSEGEEGLFYQWTEAEVLEVLGEEDGRRWLKVHGFEPGGNFTEGISAEKAGRNIPRRDRSNGAWAETLHMEPAEFETWLEAARLKLFEARERRAHPLKDDKILTDWNGLMIAALAMAGRNLDEPSYVEAAERAAAFALSGLRDPGGYLFKRYREGESGLEAHLDDYAFLVWGLIELYEATFDPAYLEAAIDLNDRMIERFADDARGGFFLAAENREDLIVRPRQWYDGAVPAGNSVAAMNLLRLARMTGRTAYEERAAALFKAAAGQVGEHPSSHGHLLSALDFAIGPSFEIVIAGGPDMEGTQAMIAALRGTYLPNAVVLLQPGGEAGRRLSELAPFTASQGAMGGRATAYVCQNFACDAPTNDASTMMASLKVRRTERMK